jgi:formylglycine-generating enzyme required for sulfatase activity
VTSILAHLGQEPSSTPYEDCLSAVDSHEAGKSPYGLHHMVGNVWEWVADWYDESYYGNNMSRNPTGPTAGESKVVRGGRGTMLRASSVPRTGTGFHHTPARRYRVPLRPGRFPITLLLALFFSQNPLGMSTLKLARFVG